MVCDTYTFIEGASTDSASISSAGAKACGQTFGSGFGSPLDKYIKSATFMLGKDNDPTGLIYCKIWNGASIVETSADTVDITTLTAGADNQVNKTFTFTQTTKLLDDWWIGVEYNAGDGSKRCKVKQTYTLIADTSTGTLTASTWSPNTSRETICSIEYCDDPASSGARLPPPPLIARF